MLQLANRTATNERSRCEIYSICRERDLGRRPPALRLTFRIAWQCCLCQEPFVCQLGPRRSRDRHRKVNKYHHLRSCGRRVELYSSSITTFITRSYTLVETIRPVTISAMSTYKQQQVNEHGMTWLKRPLTPFFLYMQNTRPVIAANLGPDAAKKDVGREGVRRWKAMSETEKGRWTGAYAHNLELYNACLHAHTSGNSNAKDMTDEYVRRYAEVHPMSPNAADTPDVAMHRDMVTQQRGELSADKSDTSSPSGKLSAPSGLEAVRHVAALQPVKRTLEEFSEGESSVETTKEGNARSGRAPQTEFTHVVHPSQLSRPSNPTQLSLMTLPTELLLLINDRLTFYGSRALRLTSHYFRATLPRPQGPLFDLPNEWGKLKILNYLQFYELWPLRQTCRRFHEIIPAMEDPPSLFSRLLIEGIPRHDEPFLDVEDICGMVEDSSFFSLCNLRMIMGPGSSSGDFVAMEWMGKGQIVGHCACCGQKMRSEEEEDRTTCWKCKRTGRDSERRTMGRRVVYGFG